MNAGDKENQQFEPHWLFFVICLTTTLLTAANFLPIWAIFIPAILTMIIGCFLPQAKQLGLMTEEGLLQAHDSQEIEVDTQPTTILHDFQSIAEYFNVTKTCSY